MLNKKYHIIEKFKYKRLKRDLIGCYCPYDKCTKGMIGVRFMGIDSFVWYVCSYLNWKKSNYIYCCCI